MLAVNDINEVVKGAINLYRSNDIYQITKDNFLEELFDASCGIFDKLNVKDYCDYAFPSNVFTLLCNILSERIGLDEGYSAAWLHSKLDSIIEGKNRTIFLADIFRDEYKGSWQVKEEQKDPCVEVLMKKKYLDGELPELNGTNVWLYYSEFLLTSLPWGVAVLNIHANLESHNDAEGNLALNIYKIVPAYLSLLFEKYYNAIIV